MSRYSTVLFDLDGTLADTLPLIYHAFDAAFRPALGLSFSEPEIRALFGPPDNHVIRTLVGDAEGEAAVSRYIAAYQQEHTRLVREFDGIAGIIQVLQEQGVRLGVVTGKSRITALFTLESLGLLDAFHAIYAGDDVEKQKPDPEAVFAILRDLGHGPAEHGAFVGDSAADMIAGRAAGLRTIAVTWGVPEHDALRAAHPDVIVDTSAQLAAELGISTSASGRTE